MTVKEQYHQYLKARREERLTGQLNGRLRIKADIARDISAGKGEWLLQRYNHMVPVFNEIYGDIAARISDGQGVNNRREPSLAESVLATQERAIVYEEIKGKYLSKTRCIIKIGSTSWAENFDVKKDSEKPSDLDLEFIIDEIKPEDFKDLPGVKEALTEFKPLHERGLVDYLSHGYKRNNWPVSIHFMPTSVFERNTNVDCTKLTEDVLATEFRMKPKSKLPVYDERYDATGREYIYEAKPQLLEIGQLTHVPVMMVGEDSRIVMGLVMAKYFTFPVIEGNKDWFNCKLDQFKYTLAQRIKAEGGGKFSEMPARKHRMPYYLLEELDQEQANYTGIYV